MTYRGKYRCSAPLKYTGDLHNIVYRSMWERQCFKWLDNNPSVKSWSSEEVVVPYFFELDKKTHRYFVDLKYTTVEGKTFLIEVKPAKETSTPKRAPSGAPTARFVTEAATYVKNQNKWAAARAYAAERGWEFEIWTEHTLQALGIQPKQTLRVKSLRGAKKSPTLKKPG